MGASLHEEGTEERLPSGEHAGGRVAWRWRGATLRARERGRVGEGGGEVEDGATARLHRRQPEGPQGERAISREASALSRLYLD